MNPLFIKAVSLIKNVTGSGLIKPLPLSGVVKEFKEMRDSKFEFKKVVRFGGYVLSGIALYGFITGAITFEQVEKLINIFLK